jgi:hypothetical protein
MNTASATRKRDQILSLIHATTLRPRGFRKERRWIHRSQERFHFAIERPQHRFESPEHATLGLEVYVFHEAYHSLMIGWPTFPGVDRMSIPVFNRGLRWLASLRDEDDIVVPATEVAAAAVRIGGAIESVVLPLFERSSSLNGLVSVVEELTPPSWQKTKTLAGLMVLQGRAAQASLMLDAAILAASDREREELVRVRHKLIESANDA